MYYKTLLRNNRCVWSSATQWQLPVGCVPGEWMPELAAPIVLHKHGYHLTTRPYLLCHLSEELYEAEFKPNLPIMDNSHESVGLSARLLRRLRWDERDARHFAIDCLREVEPALHKLFPKIDRLLAFAEEYADGKRAPESLRAFRKAVEHKNGFMPLVKALGWSLDTTDDFMVDGVRIIAWECREQAARGEFIETTMFNRDKFSEAITWQTDRLFAYLEGKA